jgi:hypothetical protein
LGSAECWLVPANLLDARAKWPLVVGAATLLQRRHNS